MSIYEDLTAGQLQSHRDALRRLLARCPAWHVMERHSLQSAIDEVCRRLDALRETGR